MKVRSCFFTCQSRSKTSNHKFAAVKVQKHLCRLFPFPVNHCQRLSERNNLVDNQVVGEQRLLLSRVAGHVNTPRNSFVSLWLENVDFPRCLICASIYTDLVFLTCGQASCKTGKGKIVSSPL